MRKLKIGTKLYSFQQVEDVDGTKFKIVEATIYSITESLNYPNEINSMMSLDVQCNTSNSAFFKEYGLVDSMNFSKGVLVKYFIADFQIQDSLGEEHLIEWFFSLNDCLENQRKIFLANTGYEVKR